MQFKFDWNQNYQLRSLEAVADLFSGQPRLEATVQFKAGTISLAATV